MLFLQLISLISVINGLTIKMDFRNSSFNSNDLDINSTEFISNEITDISCITTFFIPLDKKNIENAGVISTKLSYHLCYDCEIYQIDSKYESFAIHNICKLEGKLEKFVIFKKQKEEDYAIIIQGCYFRTPNDRHLAVSVVLRPPLLYTEEEWKPFLMTTKIHFKGSNSDCSNLCVSANANETCEIYIPPTVKSGINRIKISVYLVSILSAIAFGLI